MTVLTTEDGQPLFDGVGENLDDGAIIALFANVDEAGMAWRLRMVLPSRWFADDAPVLSAVLQGLSAGWAAIYEQIAFARLQARLATATGAFLDMAALDFLGGRLVRRPNEQDANFSGRIRQEIVRPRATRPALVQLLTDLTAQPFRIFEPARPADTGGYNVGGVGYGAGGGYGSLQTPYQVLIDAQRPAGISIPNTGAYGAALGYNVGGGQYIGVDSLHGGISDAEFYDAIKRVLPAGITAWVRLGPLQNALQQAPKVDFMWDTPGAGWDQGTLAS